MNKVACILVCAAFLTSCARQNPVANVSLPQSPTPSPILSATEAKGALASPEALTKALERRWPIAAIQTYCIPERRHNNSFQNLVAYGMIWKGTLHAGVNTGFDKVSWYATTTEGHVQDYSLEAYRGTDFWLLEIGDEGTLQASPHYSPDPTERRFVGHK
ncbi:MAG TPA: hypothetical protein VJT50_16340 [Pyrinomonadaceae bacterium]|nr:hypothetical protein [Pyrinomonadaceae bacterium]